MWLKQFKATPTSMMKKKLKIWTAMMVMTMAMMTTPHRWHPKSQDDEFSSQETGARFISALDQTAQNAKSRYQVFQEQYAGKLAEAVYSNAVMF
jgi:hypothetical protein